MFKHVSSLNFAEVFPVLAQEVGVFRLLVLAEHDFVEIDNSTATPISHEIIANSNGPKVSFLAIL